MNTAKPSESQAKFAQNRVTQVEKHFGLFCQTLGSINRKIGKTRDRTDTFAGHLMKYATTEEYNDFTRTCVTNFSRNLSLLQDYRHTQVQRLDEKVLKRLGAYGSKCKQVKVDIKRKLQALAKTQKQATKLDKIRQQSPGDIHSITRAETELKRANSDVAKETKVLEDKMVEFESSKLTDLKGSLMDFVQIEMLFHAKAIELYSECFQNIAELDEEHDLEAFRKAMQKARGQTQDMSQTLSSLTSTGRSVTFASTAGSEDTSDSQDEDPRQQTHMSGMYDDDDDEDDDDDDEDMEEDEETNRHYRPTTRYR
ncbi:hypothetical protein ScPMuIL_000145 [Solemya velum]